jgi:hypothetical protein
MMQMSARALRAYHKQLTKLWAADDARALRVAAASQSSSGVKSLSDELSRQLGPRKAQRIVQGEDVRAFISGLPRGN